MGHRALPAAWARTWRARSTCPSKQWKFLGEDPAVACPVCHCNILYIENDFPEIMCPICEVHGMVSVREDGTYSVAWNRRRRSRASILGPQGRPITCEWIMRARVGGGAQAVGATRGAGEDSPNTTPGAHTSRRLRGRNPDEGSTQRGVCATLTIDRRDPEGGS